MNESPTARDRLIVYLLFFGCLAAWGVVLMLAVVWPWPWIR